MNLLLDDNFLLVNNIGKQIKGDIRFPAGKSDLPAVIIIHGFKGFKDWGFIPYVAEKIAFSGAITITFNFSMNGIDGSSDLLDRPEDFAENTITRQLSDALIVIDFFKNKYLPEINDKWNGRIFLLGHSLGGAISLLISLHRDCIDKIALWAAISTFDRYTERQKKIWRKKGFMEFVNMKTSQALRLNLSYLEDFEQNEKEFSILDAASKFMNQLLIIHGEQDMTVPMKEALILEKAYLNNSNVTSKSLLKKIIGNTGHTFGINHPFESSNASLNEAIKTTTEFFELK
jgi:dienelactone hydrolase